MSKVLCSTPLQQAQLLLAADKNVCVSDGAEPSAADEVLNFVLYLLHAEARDLIDTLLQDRRAETLEVDELLQIVLNALTLICQRRKYQQ